MSEQLAELAGRDLDAVVAVRVMGWEWLERLEDLYQRPRKVIYPPLGPDWIRFNYFWDKYSPAQPTTERFSDWDECCKRVDGATGMPRYSTDIAAAMEVVEKMRESWSVEIYCDFPDREWNVTFCKRDPEAQWIQTDTHSVDSESLPEAICRAALIATREKVKDGGTGHETHN